MNLASAIAVPTNSTQDVILNLGSNRPYSAVSGLFETLLAESEMPADHAEPQVGIGTDLPVGGGSNLPVEILAGPLVIAAPSDVADLPREAAAESKSTLDLPRHDLAALVKAPPLSTVPRVETTAPPPPNELVAPMVKEAVLVPQGTREIGDYSEPQAATAKIISLSRPDSGVSEVIDLPNMVERTAAPVSNHLPAAGASGPGVGSGSLQIPAPTSLPQDFEALVNRLAEAREIARPQTAQLVLPHREFGSVSLHFEQGERSLQVRLASDDPAFAQSAQLVLAERAILPVAETPRTEAMSRQVEGSAVNQGQQFTAQSDGQRQNPQRSSANGRMNGEPQDNYSAPGERHPSAPPPSRSKRGLFA